MKNYLKENWGKLIVLLLIIVMIILKIRDQGQERKVPIPVVALRLISFHHTFLVA